MIKSPEFFIVSSGRAGSTLLQSILNASRQIYIPQESDFIARAYPFFGDRKSIEQSEYAQLAMMFCVASQSSGWGMTYDYILKQLEEHSPQTLAEIFSVICSAYHSQENTLDIKWGVKHPVLIASLNTIFSTYPDIKIIHICRDGRDVYLSYKNIHENSQIKFGPNGVVSSALYWVDGLRRIEKYLRDPAIQNKVISEIKYEDLVGHPQESLKDLCGFLEIQYSPSMSEEFSSFEGNKRVAPDEIMSSVHTKLKGNLDASNTKKYLKKMSKRQIFIFELLAAPYLIKYGYPLEFKLLGNWIFSPIRATLYSLGRIFNDRRYSKRDKRFFERAKKKLLERQHSTGA